MSISQPRFDCALAQQYLVAIVRECADDIVRVLIKNAVARIAAMAKLVVSRGDFMD
jgi:hypothetical protein